MTPQKVIEVNTLISQMDLETQNYALDMLRHIKFTQDILSKKNKPKQEVGKKVEYGKPFKEIYESL